MSSLSGVDIAGLAALITAVGHILFTIFKYIRTRIKEEVEEDSETITAQAGYLEKIASSAAKMIETSEKRVLYLSEQMGVLHVEYTVLRERTLELQDLMGSLKVENRRLQERIYVLERENRDLRDRLVQVERNGFGRDKPTTGG